MVSTGESFAATAPVQREARRTISTFLESPAIPSSSSPPRRAARHLRRYESRQSRAVIVSDWRSSTVVAACSTSGLRCGE